jgi:hypothetical protein
MSPLKNNILLVLILMLFSNIVKAQSSARFPYEGATHTYAWNGITEGADYEFFLTANSDGSGLMDDGSTFEFDFLDSPTGTVAPGINQAAVPIAWRNGAAFKTYHVWLRVTIPGGCSNQRYVVVKPQPNTFDLLSENIPVDNTESCPAIAAADGFNPLAPGYNAGTTTLQFKVRREGGNRGWQFEPVVGIDPSWNLDVAIVSIVAANAGTLTADASNLYTVPASDNEVTVTVAVKNYAGTEQIVSLEVRNQKEEQTRLTDSNPANDKVQHRITVMPVILDLGGV